MAAKDVRLGGDRPGGSLALPEALRELDQGRTLVVGLGNPMYGDDGVGVHVAEALLARGMRDILAAGTSPERALYDCRRYDTVLFVDAVEMGTAPGTVALMDAREIASRFPQVSTHKISIGVLARCLEGDPSVWLLGIQPQTLTPGDGLSAPVARSAQALAEAIAGADGSAGASPSHPRSGQALEDGGVR